ncbi:MAG: GIY-YIG nuclease family protein [Chloroflexi bacterium]|nr:GIY-YIG nuclease family protein [Chloroflexota bacterium]
MYAVVSGNDVKYVGICEADTRTLKKRMNSYRSSRATKSKTSTNRRVREGIREILAGGSEVKVFALDPSTREPTPITYKGIEVDLVKGLENPLTRRFNPEWNRRSPRVLDEHKERREARRVNDRLQHKIFRAANRGDRQKLLDLGLNEDLAKAWLDKVSEVKAKTRDSRERA